MENQQTQTQTQGHEQTQEQTHYNFELRHHQIYIERAMELQVTDLLKDSDEDRIAISKGDIILIFGIYKGGIVEFFEVYKKYINDCRQKRYRAVQKPHWFLKTNID